MVDIIMITGDTAVCDGMNKEQLVNWIKKDARAITKNERTCSAIFEDRTVEFKCDETWNLINNIFNDGEC